jgi:hypothetical protein
MEQNSYVRAALVAALLYPLHINPHNPLILKALHLHRDSQNQYGMPIAYFSAARDEPERSEG